MDDEEEDMSRPISQHWGTPFRDVKYEDLPTQISAGQALAGITARQPHIPFHGKKGLHVEPARHREDDDRMAQRPEDQAGVSVEVQIGRKLREIGDKFQQDHLELVSLTPNWVCHNPHWIKIPCAAIQPLSWPHSRQNPKSLITHDLESHMRY
uniref:Uncharacterized protein n=1 Tax=Anabas testudineus TaxID=64144 RepID=A0A3Q1HMF6_ANATE